MQYAEDRKIADEVLEDFASFAAIPRPSLHEKAISDYLLDAFHALGCNVIQDASYNIIADRFANPKPGSYTATLDAKRVREKVEEEAEELCEADGRDEVIWEAADLIYFVNVLMYKEGVTWKDVYDELDRRHKEK